MSGRTVQKMLGPPDDMIAEPCLPVVEGASANVCVRWTYESHGARAFRQRLVLHFLQVGPGKLSLFFWEVR